MTISYSDGQSILLSVGRERFRISAIRTIKDEPFLRIRIEEFQESYKGRKKNLVE